MWFRKAHRIKELESILSRKELELFDMSRAMFEAQQFERIASTKLTDWVQKHDALLIKCKEQHGGFKKEEGGESAGKVEEAR